MVAEDRAMDEDIEKVATALRGGTLHVEEADFG
jgi:hypothetical protein